MPSHEVEITRSAEKQLRRLPGADQERIVRRVRALAEDPFPRGTLKFSGYDDVYRVRVSHYRILYSVSESTLIIVVLKIGHRRTVCR